MAWRKSSYSTDEGPDCVEVATVPDRILVRDSKNPHGPRLTLTPTAWAAFLPYASGH
ncbi:toxin [Streptomyces sp. F-3]|nr:toxin [Streptomyces sp. F-3]